VAMFDVIVVFKPSFCQCGLSKKRNEEGIPICDGSHKLGQK
jgi:CDGSH-type Zn-finger protein